MSEFGGLGGFRAGTSRAGAEGEEELRGREEGRSISSRWGPAGIPSSCVRLSQEGLVVSTSQDVGSPLGRWSEL